MESWLERAAGLRPDVIAVEADDGALTYAELLARARAVPLGGARRVAIALPPGLSSPWRCMPPVGWRGGGAGGPA